MSIAITCTPNACEPGATLSVTVEWTHPQRPDAVTIALLWSTSGRGDEDYSVIERQQISDPPASDRRQLAFALPSFPYSFSGNLITLEWAIEVAINGGDIVERQSFIMAPGCQEIRLSS